MTHSQQYDTPGVDEHRPAFDLEDREVCPMAVQTIPGGHAPVLVDEVLRLLDPKPGQVCLDCTVGRGGHASVIAPRLVPGGVYVGLDVDAGNVAFAGNRLREELSGFDVTVHLAQSNFIHATDVLAQLTPTLVNRLQDQPTPVDKLSAATGHCDLKSVDLLLADLGFASNQVDDPQRGLSFQLEGPLDMRLDPRLTTTAADLVNRLGQRELADLIYLNSGERRSRQIAKKIVEERQRSPIQTTSALAQLVRRAYPPRHQSGRCGSRHPKGARGRASAIDPATRTFMALRIAVNAELEALQSLLDQIPGLLRPHGTAAVISFHSLEDRLVKRAFADWHRQQRAQRLTRKPLVADANERRANPRSRSAKLRTIKWSERAT